MASIALKLAGYLTLNIVAVRVQIKGASRIHYWAESDLQSHVTGNAPLTVGPNPLIIHAAFGALRVGLCGSTCINAQRFNYVSRAISVLLHPCIAQL